MRDSSSSIGVEEAGNESGGLGCKPPRVHKTLERSRDAQKRYRDRQRSRIQIAEARVDELLAEVEKLRCERDTLSARASTLEECMQRGQLPCCCQMVGKPSTNSSSGTPSPPLLRPKTEAPSPQRDIQMPQVQRAPPVPQMPALKAIQKALLRPKEESVSPSSATRLTEAVGSCWWMDRTAWDRVAEVVHLQDAIPQTVPTGISNTLSQDYVATMPVPAVVQLVSQYANAAANCLLSMDGATSQSESSYLGVQSRRLSRVICELQELWSAVLLDCPVRLGQIEEGLTHLAKPTGANGRAPPLSDVVPDIHLDTEQERAVLALRRAFLKGLAVLRRRREECSKRLQAAVSGWQSGAALGDAEARQHFLEVQEHAAGVRTTLRDEHAASVAFTLLLWRHVLSPLQAGFLLVQMYPSIMKPLAFAEVVAQQAGETGNVGVLAAAAALDTEFPADRVVDALAAVLPRRFQPWSVPSPDAGLDSSSWSQQTSSTAMA